MIVGPGRALSGIGHRLTAGPGAALLAWAAAVWAVAGLLVTGCDPGTELDDGGGGAGAVVERAEPGRGEPVIVERVIDGDTVLLVDGRRVRLLGIDACELGSAGGRRAAEQARSWVPAGSPVVLEREGLVDRERARWGTTPRLLRYVRLPDGRDLGLAMVEASHTGVYGGRHDASPNYVARLRENDRSGRDCG